MRTVGHGGDGDLTQDMIELRDAVVLVGLDHDCMEVSSACSGESGSRQSVPGEAGPVGIVPRCDSMRCKEASSFSSLSFDSALPLWNQN